MRSLLPALLIACSWTAPASATLLTLSSESSDGTPASQLDASFDFAVAGNTLTLTVTNTGSDFTINAVYFNVSDAVAGVSLLSADHDVVGSVTAAWAPVEPNARAGGFGRFDVGLTGGTGASLPSLIGPGEQIVFVFAVAGGGGYSSADFIVAGPRGHVAAAKFVSGPPDPECAGAVVPTAKCPHGVNTEDSAFGAVPEPLVPGLLALGFAGLAAAGRTRPPRG